ncbi:riboflavin synthase [Salinispira pacifica]|uniref:Riboflavin synthase n=1 Tax=Salinispira pacifica TaxID=1307761 RepID=V5WE75_9SPIO|nr:riboflavin synthase [Salinispira pacifica]AHC13940.1 Riboflavin synthase eubacterial/eukaryotic [Salinispira pacifica]
MFTGLIEELGVMQSLTSIGSAGGDKAMRLRISAPGIAPELKIGDSVAVNGACQTVTECSSGDFTVECLGETLTKTNLGSLSRGQAVNLERALRMGDRFDGHMVQGHVNETASVVSIEQRGTNRYLKVLLSDQAAAMCIPEGSIAIDGISLTIALLYPPRSGHQALAVNVIPHTWENTSLKHLSQGSRVNIETDMIGRYVARLLEPARVSGDQEKEKTGKGRRAEAGRRLYDLLTGGNGYE